MFSANMALAQWIRRRPRDCVSLTGFVFCTLSIRGAFFPKTLPGFRCDDPHIRHPFRGDTISLPQLLISVSVLPAIILLFLEYSGERCLRGALCRTVSAMSEYVVGVLLVATATEVMKLFVMELRPHFLASCRPDWTHINCSQGLVTQYSCTNTNDPASRRVDIYKSFPSGHASLSFYFFAFLTMYSNIRFQGEGRWGHRLRLLQVTAALAAVACSASRILDRRHHVQDVLSGAILGLLGGIVTIRWLAKGIQQTQESTSSVAVKPR
ncbi:phospholipid phosphatase 1-like [Ornithodoros turicata]